jgi:outer membrane cobalamin receptor
LLLDAGFRLIGGKIVEWGGFGIEGSGAGFQNVAPIENQAAPLEWQSALGGTFVLTPAASVHYSCAGGKIAPRKGSIDENGQTPANEIRFQHDLGFRVKTKQQNEFTMSAFFTQRNNAIDLSGEISTSTNDLIVELYENTDKRSLGAEFTTKVYMPVLYSYVFANATFMKNEKEESGVFKTDKELPNLIFNTGILFEKAGFDANLFINYTGPYTNNRFVNPGWITENGDFPLGNFVSADLTTGYTFSGKFSKRIFVEVKNIFDEKYQTVAGYPDVGRLIQMGIKISL